MVECGGLENRFARNPGNEGSNPSSSATKFRSAGLTAGGTAFPLRLPVAPDLRAIPKTRVPKYASPSRSHESPAPQKPSAAYAQPG